jgi:hypothetical protein
MLNLLQCPFKEADKAMKVKPKMPAVNPAAAFFHRTSN